MSARLQNAGQPPYAPRGIALSGILFSLLFTSAIILIRVGVLASSADPGAWLADPGVRERVALALNLIPFAGIAFLWFMGVLRNHVGHLEDRFFATIFLGSGFLFVAVLFAAVALSHALLEVFGPGHPGPNDAYRLGRVTVYELVNTFGMRMAAVFTIVSSTIGMRTGVLPRPVVSLGLVCGASLLLGIAWVPWMALLFPLWVLIVTAAILLGEIRPGQKTPGASQPDLDAGERTLDEQR